MGSDEELFALFDDLESQAEAEFVAERDLEVAERVAIEYREVTWSSRVCGSLGLPVSIAVAGVGVLSGRLERAGAGWLVLAAGSGSWLVVDSGIEAITGLGPRSIPEAARGVGMRLGLGSPMRAIAESGRWVVIHLSAGGVYRGRIGRVGADFHEMHDDAGTVTVVPWQAIAVVRFSEDR